MFGRAGAQLELLDDDVDYLDVLLNSDLQASNGLLSGDIGLLPGQMGSANTTQAGNDFVELSLAALQELEPCGSTAPTAAALATGLHEVDGRGEPSCEGRAFLSSCNEEVTCLHADEHAQPCTLCTEAPEDFACTELVGQAGRRNGNKLLRARIMKTRQWADLAERKKVSRIALEHGLSDLAKAVVDAKGGDLRKEELLFLARQWGLRSNIWRRRMSNLSKAVGARNVPGDEEAAAEPEIAPVATAAAALTDATRSDGAVTGRGGVLADTSARCSSGSGPSGSGHSSRTAEHASIWGGERGRIPSYQQYATASLMLMDRTAVAQDMDRPTLVRFVGGASLAPAVPTFVELDLHCTSPNIGCNWMLALQHNTIKRLHDIGDRTIEIHSTAGLKCEELIKAGSPCFVNEETSENVAASIRTGEVVNAICSRLHSLVFASVIDAQAVGPQPVGASTEARLLSGSDFTAEMMIHGGKKNFTEIRDLIMGIQAQRVVSNEGIGEAQKCWEDGYVQSYTAHMEMLNLVLEALEIARRDSSSRDPYLTYLQIVTSTLAFFVSYNPRTLASHIVRKRWVDSVLASRRTGAGGCGDGYGRALPATAQFPASNSWDAVTAAAVAGSGGADASKAPTLRLLNLANGTVQALPQLG